MQVCRIIKNGDIMAMKTNAVRLVQQAKIPCREVLYEFDERDLSGIHAAEATGMPPEQVFKTLVARGEKNVEMVAVKELLNLTGYIRGGCSPVGMKKKYPTFLDETCVLWEEIAVSAGARGHQMIVPPEDLAKLVDAVLADIIK